MMGNNSGALWSPAFEADSFDTFVLQERGLLLRHLKRYYNMS